MLKILNALPLLIIAVAIYFAGTYLALQQAADTAGSFWHANAFDLRLPSGTVWSVTWSAILLSLAMLGLLVEVALSANTNSSQLINHVLSVLLLIASLIAFLILPRAGTTEFFLLLMMMFVDVTAGLIISIIAARRDFSHNH